MGLELEFKLAVATPALLEQILLDSHVATVRQGGYTLLNMATTYYDTPDRRCSARRWTLRLRQENEKFVATLKTPAVGKGKARGEWQCEVTNIQSAIPMLVEAGVGVAMGNASDAVKQAADLVTLSNNEDGIAAALEKLL